VIGAIVNIINVNNFNAFFNLKTIERSLITRINGFQLNSNNLGLTLALGFILVVRDQIILFKLKYLSVLLVLILIVLTGSRSAYLLVLFYIIYSLWTSKVKYYRFFLIFSSIFVGVLLLETIYNSDFYKITERNITDTTSGASSTGGYIRGVIISNGFKLASDNFPFGTGAASYGSVLSENSPVYKELGLSNKLFFQDMTGIYDSNFATIIGEFGLFGIFLFLFHFSQLKKTYTFFGMLLYVWGWLKKRRSLGL
jgi:O-antigen ligase